MEGFEKRTLVCATDQSSACLGGRHVSHWTYLGLVRILTRELMTIWFRPLNWRNIVLINKLRTFYLDSKNVEVLEMFILRNAKKSVHIKISFINNMIYLASQMNNHYLSIILLRAVLSTVRYLLQGWGTSPDGLLKTFSRI